MHFRAFNWLLNFVKDSEITKVWWNLKTFNSTINMIIYEQYKPAHEFGELGFHSINILT